MAKLLPNQSLLLMGLSLLMLVSALLSLMIGAVNISPTSILAIIFTPILAPMSTGLSMDLTHYYTQIEYTILWDIRMPRVLLAILTGLALALAGAAMQGLFRNPLADPGLIGASAGAALAAVAVIVFSSQFFGLFTLPIAAFLGAIVATLIVYQLATRHGSTSVATMLLAGIAISAIATAGTGLLTYMADDAALRNLTFWTMGSLANASWNSVVSMLPFVLLAIGLLPLHARALNGFLMGENISGHLGFNPRKTKQQVILLTALLVGAAVAAAGIIGFVGLIVPHLVRLLSGPDHRMVLPGSMLLGASLMLLADLIARTALTPAELPLGIIMAIIGGPFFLWLLMQRIGRQGL